MSHCIVVRGEDGKVHGLGVKGERSYARFRAKVESMEIGETMEFEWREPRSPKFHRLFFAMLHELFDRQERFDDANQLRAWITVGAGYCDYVPGVDGQIVAIPQSIAWIKMDDGEFRELVRAVWYFLRTEHAQRFLWPSLSRAMAYENAEAVLIGWDS